MFHTLEGFLTHSCTLHKSSRSEGCKWAELHLKKILIESNPVKLTLLSINDVTNTTQLTCYLHCVTTCVVCRMLIWFDRRKARMLILLEPAILFSRTNKMLLGYLNPINIFFDIKSKYFSGWPILHLKQNHWIGPGCLSYSWRLRMHLHFLAGYDWYRCVMEFLSCGFKIHVIGGIYRQTMVFVRHPLMKVFRRYAIESFTVT